MAADVSRVEIGFDGGLIVITKIAASEWTAVEKALEAARARGGRSARWRSPAAR